MNVDDDNTTPLTNLGLSLRHFNRYFQTRLNDESGASANAAEAASRVKMTFVANDSLSELVWSPHNGLRLKCADFSFDEKKPSLLWGAGQSNTFFSPLSQTQTIFGNIDTGMEGENIITTGDSLVVMSEVGETGTLVISPTSDCEVMPVRTSSHELNAGNDGNIEHMNTAVEAVVSGIKIDHIDDQMTGKSLQVNVLSPPDGVSIHIKKADSLSFKTDKSGLNIVSRGINKLIGSGPSNAGGDLGSDNKKIDMDISVSQINSMKLCGSTNTLMPNQLSVGVNDQHLALLTEEEIQSNMKIISSTGSPLEKVELTDENDLQAQVNENNSGHEVKESFPKKNKSLNGNCPSYSSFQRHRRKGKEKALSGPTNNPEENDDNSHESVESCNSVGLFSKGKKRVGFEQKLIFGNKRLKKQCQENHGGSTSFIRPDSSFMSWISNMMKVLPKSNYQETPPLALTVAQSNHDHQKDIVYERIEDHGRKNTGFQNIFRSLYCCDTKRCGEIGTPSSEFQTNEESNELEFVNKECDVNVTPIAFLGASNMFHNQYLLENEKLDQSISGNVACGSTHAKIPSLNFVASRAGDSEENIAGPACSSLGKHKAESSDSNPPFASKPHNNFSNKNELMRSLWITRFCPKTMGSGLKLDRSQQVLDRLDTNTERNLEAGSTDLQSYAANSEAFFGLRGIKGHNRPKKLYRLRPDQTSKRLKNSEAMSSIFARRLDALKHIIPSSDAMGNATRTIITCFYCGVQGHDIRDCSKITEIELEDLLSSIHSFDGAEKSPCLCVKCFQLNHWAVACPNIKGNTSKLQLDKGHERNLKLLETQESNKIIVANLSAGKQIIASSFEGNGSKENLIPTNNFVNREILDVPKGISDAIKRLRLSRTDIFKCMNSQVPLSYLDGFFLRLRLGKWEEGLGGTGYYVGYIDGTPRENAPTGSKNPISVIIGGLKCSVESQYVSNNDFLEDEVTAWWSVTLKGGGKIPSQEDMKIKLEERKKIGL